MPKLAEVWGGQFSVAECESAAALSSPAPAGLPKLHQDKQRSSVVFQEVRWAKRKHRARKHPARRWKEGAEGCSQHGEASAFIY